MEESSFSQDMQWLLERGVQFADVAFYAGESGKELGWAHAAVLCAVSPYFRQLLLGPKTRWDHRSFHTAELNEPISSTQLVLPTGAQRVLLLSSLLLFFSLRRGWICAEFGL